MTVRDAPELVRVEGLKQYYPVNRGVLFRRQVGAVRAVDGISFSIEETFDVGEDTGSPIIEDVYAVPFRFEHLEKLTLKLEQNEISSDN